LTVAVLANISASVQAGITSYTISGTGGTVSDPHIATLFSTNDSLDFTSANYTSLAPINFEVNVDSPGYYAVGYGGVAMDSTTSAFPSFYGYLSNAPAGSVINQAFSYDPIYPNVSFAPPLNPTSVIWSGPPGLMPGQASDIGFVVIITGTGPQSFDVTFTPVAQVVPEPSTLLLSGIAAIAGLGAWARRRRRF
jgi:PEP-CTERM motif